MWDVMIPRSVFVSVASGVLLAASGCSGDDSGPNGVPVISFHYVSTGEFTYEGETETQR
jgi:hypothetical protein